LSPAAVSWTDSQAAGVDLQIVCSSVVFIIPDKKLARRKEELLLTYLVYILELLLHGLQLVAQQYLHDVILLRGMHMDMHPSK